MIGIKKTLGRDSCFVLFTCKLVYIITLYMTEKREMCKVINIQWKNKELNDSNTFLYNIKYLVDSIMIYNELSGGKK